MMLMIIVLLAILGLIAGSFINALVWRLHEQSDGSEKTVDLSILKGRSVCPNCHHKLAAKDLLPVISWLLLRGKCRYCGKPISSQYPVVELITAALFVASYVWWPHDLDNSQKFLLAVWLVALVGLIALAVYDLKWKLLPNRLIYPLSVVAGLYALVSVVTADSPLKTLLEVILAVVIGGGFFYVLFQLSDGKWIGGGDVKLGWLLGLIVGTPGGSVLFIFIGALAGSLVSLPLMATKRLKRTSTVPFGPFLILGAMVAQLFGASILAWYRRTFITF